MHKTAITLLMTLAASIGQGRAASTMAGEAKPTQASSSVSDCSAQAKSLPQGTTRVYIALRSGKDGSGASMADARDGSTVTAFDTVLRCYSEGCTDPKNPKKSVAKTENLTVCLGSGTFSTLGAYDYLINIPHKNPAGFTIGKGWKIHGAGKDKTVVKLTTTCRSRTLKISRVCR